jgi:hypothetical protein
MFVLDALSIFGLLALAACMTFDSRERRHPTYTLLFGVACVAASIYGFLQGAWPFGIAEGIWACLKFREYFMRLKDGR